MNSRQGDPCEPFRVVSCRSFSFSKKGQCNAVMLYYTHRKLFMKVGEAHAKMARIN